MNRTLVYWLGMVLALGAAVVLRVPGMFNDFWLDEIWSLRLVALVDGPGEIFTVVRHDNNHWLHSLFLYALGDQSGPVYRLPSLLAGSASVVLAGLIGLRFGRLEGFLSVVLVGGCYLLIHYSSEARGYGLAVFFALACFYLLQQKAPGARWSQALLFSASAMLGFLSHLTFLWAYLGTLTWSLMNGWDQVSRKEKTPRQAAAIFLAHHAFPLLGMGILYLVNVRHMLTAGAEPRPIWRALEETVLWTLGAPDHRLGIALAVLLVASALLQELWWERSVSRNEALGYATVIGAPLLLALLRPPPFFYARFFLVSIPFVLVVLARFLARCWRGGFWRKALATAALALFLAGNFREMLGFWQDGRGHFHEAIRYMSEHTPGAEVKMEDVKTLAMTIQYYQRQDPGLKTFVYGNEEPPDWLVLSYSFEPAVAPPAFVDLHKTRYIPNKRFRHHGASGLTWTLYRPED